MAEPAPRGLPAAEALWCLLRLHGHEGPLEAFTQAHGRDLAPAAMAGPLEREGLQARPVRIRGGELRFLALPTLARHRDGSWLVILARTRGGYRVLGSGGPMGLGVRELQEQLEGQVLDLAPGLPSRGSLWGRLRDLMARHRGVVAMIVAATVAIQLLGLAGPALVRVVMNRALPDGAGSLLALVAAATVLAALFHAWIEFVRGRALQYFTTRLALAAERGFLEHLLALPYPLLRSRPLGEWLQAFGGFQAARELLAEKTLGVFLDGALALVLLLAMAWLLPGAAALVAATTLVLAAATLLAGRAQARLQALEVEVGVKEQGLLAELLGGVATLKAAGAEDLGLGRWRRLYRQGLGLALRRGRIGLGVGTGLSALAQAVDAALLVWGGLQVVRGALDLGTFLAFLQMATAFMAAALGVNGTCLSLMLLAPQLAKASGVLELAPEAPVPPRPALPAPLEVVMEGVWFRYRPEGPWVLGGRDLRVAAGGSLELDGPSGCGKSTLLRLLAGLETPERGDLLIGGLPPAHARSSLLYLPQSVQLYGGSILENLAVLSGGADGDALMRAAARTGLDAWIATLPMGYKTILPHGGRTLSGGQRQWVALTAAVASGRGVLLLDEPLAGLDPAAAARLNGVLASGGWTLITAGHPDPSPADR